PGTEEVIESPGARSDRKDATFENHATVSLFVVALTLTAEETHAGVEIDDGKPLLPDATTVATLIARRLSMIGLKGSSSHGAVNGSPARLMFTTAMLRVLASEYTRSSPAMISDV